ncbi:MAG: hypothetical protein HWE23_13965 [Rhodobacteraceae bacterium]|nr:hypothetical protein [Paracoccaceae bacterium]
MHVILLKFGSNKPAAPQFMQAHNDWVSQGLADGIFQCVGSLDVGGGCILARGEDHDAILRRVNQDPFVENDVVTAEILKVDVNRTSPEWSQLFC